MIVMQQLVHVRESDTVETLSARILEQEHRAYREAIQRVLSGRYEVRGRRYLSKNTRNTRKPATPASTSS